MPGTSAKENKHFLTTRSSTLPHKHVPTSVEPATRAGGIKSVSSPSPANVPRKTPQVAVGQPPPPTSEHAKQPPALPACPWSGSPEHQQLYQTLQSQTFNGYGSVDKLMSGKYRIPNASIDFALSVLRGVDRKGFPKAQTRRDTQSYVGFDAVSLEEVGKSAKGLTVGKAIQKIFMLRLGAANKLQPMTNLNQVWSDLFKDTVKGTVYLGDMVDSLDFELLNQCEITVMVSVHPNDWRSSGREQHGQNGTGHPTSNSPIVERLHLNLEDNSSANMEPQFDIVYNFVMNQANAGKNVLIHCMAGQSRSGTMALYFALRLKMERLTVNLKPKSLEKVKEAAFQALDLNGVFKQLKKKRPGVKLDNFEGQLRNAIRKLCKLEKEPLPKPVEVGPKASPKLQEAILIAFCLYRLRPTAAVMSMIPNVEKTYGKNQENLQTKDSYAFVPQLIKWVGTFKIYEDAIK